MWWALILLGAHGVSAHEEHGAESSPTVLAPGYGELGFVAPEPGTYTLPPLGEAADGGVLAEDGRATTLYQMFDDRIVLLSFIYASCSDVNGCPLATAVLHDTQRRLGRVPEIAGRARFVSLSFDPARDTPDVMQKYGERMAGGDLEWRFLTTASEAELRPILDAYGQSVIVERDSEGNSTGAIAHILRVFLIDAQRRVRNVYSVSFLHADTLAADLRTVLMEAGPPSPIHSPSASPLRGPGDDRSGYERPDYRSRSIALASRTGAAADLVSRAESPPLGLPALPIPRDNPLTRAKVDLGRKLFFDRRLSLNQTVSCAMCHIPEQGFTNNELATAVGLEGRTVRRNSPTLLNVGYQSRLFHDGREDRLEHQIWGPLLARNEMANPSVGAVLARIRRAPDYGGMFEASFPERGLSMESVGMALASYERTLVSGNSAFDRWRYGGEAGALSPAAQRGFAIFAGKGACLTCHPLGEKSALFTDGELHNTGIGYRQSMGQTPSKRRIQVAPGQWLEVEAAIVARVSDPVPGDLGYYEITQDPGDRWKYRTPTLREVARTAPYMHDGSLPTLHDVVHFYNEGGVPNATLDPAVRPLGLSDAEVDDLVTFLEALGGSDVDTLVSDAFAAPVGDPVTPR